MDRVVPRYLEMPIGKNAYELEDDHFKLRLKEGVYTLLDKEDLQKVSSYTWNIGGTIRKTGSENLYVRAAMCGNNTKRMILLHRIVMDADPGQIVDHINHDYLDNRKSNLRFVTRSQNSQNRRQWKTKKTVTGVTYRKDRDAYRIRLKVDGKMRAFGYRKDRNEAEALAIELKNKYYGEFSVHWKP